MKNKKIILITSILLIFILLVGVTYAFFSYTREGSNNNKLQAGTIEFSSTETTINLQNVFPTTRTSLNSSNSGTATITIKGDTTYNQGIEYKVTIEDVNNTINGKELPISLNISANNLGTKSSDYYNERGSTTNVYKLTEEGEAYDGKYVLVGYIKPDTIGVDGSINITAYIDSNKMVISDTYDGTGTGLMATTSEEIAGREVFTTSEWESFNSSNPLSFKVKVEAQEGTWVEPEKFITMKNLNNITEWTNIRANITSIEFHKDGVAPANPVTSFDVTDTTSDPTKGNITLYTVDDGLGNNTYKAIIVANDTIYAPASSSSLFSYMTSLESINSKNFKVDNVKDMSYMFWNCINLQNISSLSIWNTLNVNNMLQLFATCKNLRNIRALSNWDVSNVENIQGMFGQCSSLSDISPLINWNTQNVLNMSMSFTLTMISNLNSLSNWNVSNVTMFIQTFANCSNLEDASGINNWNINASARFNSMFGGSTTVHPGFTKFPNGTWNEGGTFTPNA